MRAYQAEGEAGEAMRLDGGSQYDLLERKRGSTLHCGILCSMLHHRNFGISTAT